MAMNQQQFTGDRQRKNFENALKRARCPTDKGRVFEIAMPEVVCEKCNVRYIMAIRPSIMGVESKLLEKKDSSP